MVFLKGFLLVLKEFCHHVNPWGSGGFDPVKKEMKVKK